MKAARLVVLGIALAASGAAAFQAGGSGLPPPAPMAPPPPQIAAIDMLVAMNDIGIGIAPAADDKSRGGRLNTIRFGVSTSTPTK